MPWRGRAGELPTHGEEAIRIENRSFYDSAFQPGRHLAGPGARRPGHDVEPEARILFASHYLERIGDRVTNIAEDIVFFASGEVEDLNP